MPFFGILDCQLTRTGVGVEKSQYEEFDFREIRMAMRDV
jgi:hypothetical protein